MILLRNLPSRSTTPQQSIKPADHLISRISGNFDSRLTIGPNALLGGPLRDLIEISPEKRPSRRQSLSLKPEFV
jgi:hypothetical protein